MRSANDDRVLQRKLPGNGSDLGLIAVADGISRCPSGGMVAHFIVEEHLANDLIFAGGNGPLANQFEDYLAGLGERFYAEHANEPDMLESGATLSAALLEGETAHCFWVGDSPIVVARRCAERFETVQISVPDTFGRVLIDCFGAGAPFVVKRSHTVLARGDVLLVGSDGAIRDLESLTDLLNEHGPSCQLLSALRSGVQTAPYYDDASLVLAERL